MGTGRVAVLGILIVVFQASSLTTKETTTKPSTCVPGFKSDVLIFRVVRKHLRQGTTLGKVGFSDCTGRAKFLFSSDNSHFKVQTDGTLKVKRPADIHGHQEFSIHSWDSQGHKMSVPVRVVHHGHHRGSHHPNVEHHRGNHHPNVEHHRGSPHPNVEHHRGNHHPNVEHHRGSPHPNVEHHRGNPHPNVEHHRGSPHPNVEHHNGERKHHKHQHHHTDVASANNTEVPVLNFPKTGGGLIRRKRDWVIPELKVSENKRGPYPILVAQIRSNEDKVQKIFYSITGPGASEPPVDLFTMTRDSGNLYLTQPLDREETAVYRFKAHAVAEGAGTAEAPMDIIVKVIDQNDNKPTFAQDTFLGEVAEASPKGYEVIKVVATDIDEENTDNSEIRYRILSQDPALPPNLFVINPVTGAIRVDAGGLDREKNPTYTLVVQAADMAGDGLTNEAKVILTVTDSNDNAPAFTQPSYEASVKENAVDAYVVKMLVTDGDEPLSPAWNAKFTIVGGDPGGHFTVKTGSNKHEGIISTAKGLDFERSTKHTLLVAVENEVPFATPLPTATATVVVSVLDVNEAPIFDPMEKHVSKLENLALGSDVVQYTASDPDTARKQTVMYKIIRDPAGWLNVSNMGLIKVRKSMDREALFVKDNKYTVLIGAYDNDDVPATGTGTLIIQLEDVNDNAPTIEQRSITVCHKESAPQLLSVTDKDGPGFAAPYSVSLQGISKTNWTARMNASRTGIILNLATVLERGDYTVVLRVSDNHGEAQDSTVLAKVCDCTGEEVSCQERGVAGATELPVILGILGGILLLLMLVLLLLLFARRRRGEQKVPLLQDDDIRDNIYYYDEEGGGEDDQDYDLGVLHRGLDNRPEVFRNDVMPNFMPAPLYRPRPANPEEIGNFIDDNLKAADNDPTAPPYDSLLVFDYEGGGSDAGSLSSLNSSCSGNQDYDCLNEWGSRFKKLADMYGGGDDDDDDMM